MAVFLLHWWVFGWTLLMAVRVLFACALIALFAIDLEHHLLPDSDHPAGHRGRADLQPGRAAGHRRRDPGRDARLACVLWVIGEAYFRYSGQEGMGGGDVKMLAMIGAFLGWKLVLVTLVLSSVTGSLIGMAVIAAAARRHEVRAAVRHLPGRRRAAASLVGDRVVAWYTGLYAGI